MKLDAPRLRRASAALLAACTNLLANAGPAHAENTTGEVVVTVRDTATGKAPDEARVLLLGASFTASRTDVHGDVRYTDVPPGIYRIRVVLVGYGPSRAESVAIRCASSSANRHLAPYARALGQRGEWARRAPPHAGDAK